MTDKFTISDQIKTCRRLIEQAEEYAYDGFYDESNSAWSKASEIAINLIKIHDASKFMDDEYRFLKSIINHIREED